MIENFGKLDKNIREKRIWKQDDIFDAIWNEQIDEFFNNYKKFDEYLVTKDRNALIYSGHVFLDTEHSWKLHSDFHKAFEDSIKWIVGESIFERMRIFFEEKNYLLSTESKRFDWDPFLDDDFQVITLWDKTIAQFIEKRNAFNNVEFHYIIYPHRIFLFINDLLKKYNLFLH